MCLNKSDTYSHPNNFQKGTVPHVIKRGTMQKSRQFVCTLAAYFWFARHGRALTGESPEHAWATRKCIAEQQGCLS